MQSLDSEIPIMLVWEARVEGPDKAVRRQRKGDLGTAGESGKW